jgi:SAM-dependent methyltransferase
MSEICERPKVIVPPDNELFAELAHNPHSQGWHYAAGPPEFWRFADRLLKPEGRLLDLGAGLGGSCMFFALHGMDVTAIDNNSKYAERLGDLAADLGSVLPLRLDSRHGDIVKDPLPEASFDTTILSHLIHMPSRDDMLELIDKAYSTVKPGGHLWVRVGGKQASDYEMLRHLSGWEYSIQVVDEDIIEAPCACSGDLQIEPIVFMDPMNPQMRLARLGARIVHSQTIPTRGKMNVMFGEDYNRRDDDDADYSFEAEQHQRNYVGGMTTVIAQKPDSSVNLTTKISVL